MKSNIIIILLLLFLFSINTTICQAPFTLYYQDCQGGNCNNTNPSTLPNYNPAQPFQTSSIASDFGRRYYQGSPWHNGIDYGPVQEDGDLGYHLITPVNGQIAKIGAGAGFKYIFIAGNNNYNFGYGHIFTTGSSLPMLLGDLVLAECTNVGHYAIINLSTQHAYGPYSGNIVNYLGVQYTVESAITANTVVAPLGNSGTTVGNAHLHFYYLIDPNISPNNNTTKNPDQVIAHDEPNYSITIDHLNELTELGGNTFYSGSSLAAVRVRCFMNNAGGNGQIFTNATMDIDKVELFMKKDYESSSNYSLIQGNFFESKISNGGRWNENRYPSSGYPSSNITYDIADIDNEGNQTHTGIEPWAYRIIPNGQPYDNYFFSNIYTRIRSNCVLGQTSNQFARCIEEARYPDGIYDLYARATNVNNHSWISSQTSPTRIIIDNFIPYVQKVEMYYGTKFYSAGWNWDPSTQKLIFSPNQGNSTINSNEACNLKIKVYFSEPMSYATIHVQNLGYQSFNPIINTNDQVWETDNIPNTLLTNSGSYSVLIDGQDINGNSISGFSSNQTYFQDIPIRQEDGTFYPAPNFTFDHKHFFYVDLTLNNKNCDFSASSTYGNYLLVTTFTDQSTGSPISWDWNFGNGVVSNVQSPPAVTYINETDEDQQFSVSLTVKYSDLSEKIMTKTNYINISPNGGGNQIFADFTFSQVSDCTPSTVDFTDLSCGNIASYYWDFGDPSSYNNTSNAQNPTHTFNNAGTYNVTLTVSCNYSSPNSYTMPIYVYDYVTNGLTVDFSWDQNPIVEGTTVNFNREITGDFFNYDCLWDFGDNSNTSFMMDPMHVFSPSGRYNVKLEIYDDIGILRGAKSHLIEVVPYSVTPIHIEDNQLCPWGEKSSTWLFGISTAINSSFAAIGSQGKVFVFKKDEDSWSPFQKLEPTGNPYFGFTLDMTEDWIIVGDHDFDNHHGAIYFYQFDPNQNKWIGGDPPIQSPNYYNDKWFGEKVTISGGAGDYAAVISTNSNNNVRRAYVFHRLGSVWTFSQCIDPIPEINNTYSWTDGNTIKLMGYWLIINGTIYQKDYWGQYQYYQSTMEGSSVTSNGYEFLIGANNLSSPGCYPDQSELFQSNGIGNNFVNSQDFTNPYENIPPLLSYLWGSSVSLYNNYGIIGMVGYGYISGHYLPGKAFLYRRDHFQNYEQLTTYSPSNGQPDDYFGCSIAMNNEDAIIGARHWNETGTAYYYKYQLFDCDKHIKKCNYTYSAINHGNIYAGLIELGGNNCNIIVPSGCIIRYGGNDIALNEGFTANYGSTFTATADLLCSPNCYFHNNIGDSTFNNDVFPKPYFFNPQEKVQKIVLYPNPTTGELLISFRQTPKITNIDIFSTIGKLVLHMRNTNSNLQKLNISTQPPGIYFLHIESDDNELIFKVIKD